MQNLDRCCGGFVTFCNVSAIYPLILSGHTVEVTRIDIKTYNRPRRPQFDDRPVIQRSCATCKSRLAKTLTSHKLDCGDGFPSHQKGHHWGRTAPSGSVQAVRGRDTRSVRAKGTHRVVTSVSKSWEASAKKSSDTETTEPPSETLDSSRGKRRHVQFV
jgi:hypothetical protein